MSTSTYINLDGPSVSYDGGPPIPAAPGWNKCWLYENVYGWEWIGPGKLWRRLDDLCVLGYEPSTDERRAIEARFADAPTPDGDPVFVYPPRP